MSDPFDLSKALEGAAVERLSPDVARFRIHSDYSPLQTKILQLKN